MTTVETPRDAVCAQDAPMVHRLIIWVPIAIICAGLLATVIGGVIAGLLAAAMILGWSQLAGL
jgi:hypothetical protein